MSSDNYWVIQPTKDGRWGVWMQFVSNEEDLTGKPMWTYSTPEKAIAKAQREYSEYGFTIGGLNEQVGKKRRKEGEQAQDESIRCGVT